MNKIHKIYETDFQTTYRDNSVLFDETYGSACFLNQGFTETEPSLRKLERKTFKMKKIPKQKSSQPPSETISDDGFEEEKPKTKKIIRKVEVTPRATVTHEERRLINRAVITRLRDQLVFEKQGSLENLKLKS